MTARTRFLGAALAVGALTEPFVERLARSYPHLDGAPKCAEALRATETEWKGTGEWRALSPYPTQREASPTLTVGVWLERSHSENGTTELRRVSAQQTDVAAFDPGGCLTGTTIVQRSFNPDSAQHAFTDSSLDSLLSTNGRGLIYVWSPRMPLSVKGMEEARAAATSLGLAFTALAAQANEAELRELHVPLANQRRLESLELVYRNATIHYPTVVLYNQKRIIDGAYPGYKNRATYELYAREKLVTQELKTMSAGSPAWLNDAPFWVDHNARVTTLSAVNTPRRIGFFFKPITGTSLVSYNAGSVDYFFDMETGRELRVPGYIDPVPTPDGRFLTLPGLHFHPVKALLSGNRAPLYSDPELPDEYQTASVLRETNSVIRYRVVTGWNAGARFRDYDVALDKSGLASGITPVGEPFVPCKDRLLTLPINAKSGVEFGAFDARTQTNMVLAVPDSTHCTLKLDLGFASGKLSFSYDGTAIAFATSRVNTDTAGPLIRPSELFHKDALVLVRKTGRIIALTQNATISGLTFPEFQKNGTVMLLDQFGPGRPVEQLRVVAFK